MKAVKKKKKNILKHHFYDIITLLSYVNAKNITLNPALQQFSNQHIFKMDHNFSGIF